MSRSVTTDDRRYPKRPILGVGAIVIDRSRVLVKRLRDGAKELTRKAGKRTAKVARAVAQPSPRRKTVARATAAKKRTARAKKRR